ncbi:hypothetical protein H8E77_43670 [bacterium]|nr:hypothetical protein [bacterium]
MSNEVISAEQIQGLEELIAEFLNRKIAQVSSNAEDIEQLKKSPAGTIIRLEEHINAIDEKIAGIRTQMAEIRTQMVTKAEFAIMNSRIDRIESKMATKQDLERIEGRVDSIKSRMAKK